MRSCVLRSGLPLREDPKRWWMVFVSPYKWALPLFVQVQVRPPYTDLAWIVEVHFLCVGLRIDRRAG